MSKSYVPGLPRVPETAEASAWPFAILRNYGPYESNRDFIARTFAAQKRHPGLIHEIWFAGSYDSFGEPGRIGESALQLNRGMKERCRELGIKFSYQQGVTLNHGQDGVKRDGFPEDAWAVGAEGQIRYGLFCCTSPFVKDYCREKAKAILAALKPDSYWPDDDMRLFKEDWSRPCLCFCDRCLKLFGERFGHRFTRPELLAKLNGEGASAEIRREWCEFNGVMLGEYAAVFREAVDAASPSTRLGIQMALSGNVYDGRSWETILKALAGKSGKAGTRPGGLYYNDTRPIDLAMKMNGVAREAARSGRLAETAQICYETENWPHVGAQKNANGMMAECAYALAVGCDSIAFYWGADQNGEDDASYDFWFDAMAAWRPFHLAVRDTFKGTRLGGVAAFHGGNHFATPEWITHDEHDVPALVWNAVPVGVTEAEPDMFWLNERAVRTLSMNDLETVFSRPVLMDAWAFDALGKRFPALKFAQNLRVASMAAEKALATDKRTSGYETFPSGKKCENVKALLYPQAPGVVRLSEMTADPQACGTCIVPTEFGGKVVVAQDVPSHRPHAAWPGCRRHAILDGLDAAVPGGMPARLVTDGYAVSISVSKTAEGKTAGVFLFNFGSGETPPMELAIRRGASNAWKLALPKRAFAAAEIVRETKNEIILRVPALPALGTALVFI